MASCSIPGATNGSFSTMIETILHWRGARGHVKGAGRSARHRVARRTDCRAAGDAALSILHMLTAARPHGPRTPTSTVPPRLTVTTLRRPGRVARRQQTTEMPSGYYGKQVANRPLFERRRTPRSRSYLALHKLLALVANGAPTAGKEARLAIPIRRAGIPFVRR